MTKTRQRVLQTAADLTIDAMAADLAAVEFELKDARIDHGRAMTGAELTLSARVRASWKAILCRWIAWLPCRLWTTASRVVRTLWPGFRDA